MELCDDRELRAIILDRIREKGRITFADYMRACLYEPGLGYYTSPGRKVGAAGDFYTSINVHRLFGRLIAREIGRMWETMGAPPQFDIAEVGAGNGRLARDILDTIAEINSPLYGSLTYRLIEAEPSLHEIQRDMLGSHGGKAAWNAPADMGNGRLSFSGCLLSNELIDSFPVHLVEMTRGGLMEIYVTAAGDAFAETLDLPSTPELEEYLKHLGIELFAGQRAEINLEATRWLADVARSLARGFVMTIDYGYPAAELYAPLRKNGTLLCYYRHRVEENPYIRVGRQDMTAHVDFTTLISKGEELGLANVWFGEQYRFLMGAGMMEEMMTLEARAGSKEERLKNRLVLKKLILPDGGMGDTFKILIQAKGVDNPRLLCMREWSRGL
ncbi:MAG TPA: SAM-dependent methyltransferase [Geobacteraceae bacterium]|nr:SAM-dependent methyltransferase [Geobacteraceae bacterium]